jgi:hypothetical protein
MMSTFRRSTFGVLAAAGLVLAAPSARPASAAPLEIKGAAILDHPATKVALRNMSLMHAGKVEEAVQLGSKAMQEQWAAMSADDRKMMGEMMKAFAVADAEFKKSVSSFGVLSVDGNDATLVVKEEKSDSTGKSTSTQTMRLTLESGEWRVTNKK